MNEKEIRKMLIDIIAEVDYDISKFYDPETSEDPETAEESMQDLVLIVKKYMSKKK